MITPFFFSTIEGKTALQHITVPLSLSIIGCVVNGPGEAKETDIGLTGGGKGNHMVYLNGVSDHKINDDGLVEHIIELVEAKVEEITRVEENKIQDEAKN